MLKKNEMISKKNVPLLVLLICLLVRVVTTLPMDDSIPNGADHTSHLFKVWYISEHGWTKWNPYWYAGYQFLKFYPPLSYMLAGYMGAVLGYLLSYKLVISLFYVLTPIAFYLLLKEFDFPNQQKVVALLVFSLMPVYHYYFADGRTPALVAVFFSLLFWKFLKRYIESRNQNDLLVFASVLLSLSMLSHHLIGAFTSVVTFVWAMVHLLKYETFVKLLKIGLLTLMISLWWVGPFVLESMSSVSKGVGELQMIEPDISIERFSGYPFGMSLFYSHQWSEQLILLALGFIGVISLVSFIKPSKPAVSFIVVLMVIAALVIFVRYKRAFFLLPIPISILASYGIKKFSKGMHDIALLLLVVLLIVSYFSIEVKVVGLETHFDLPKDGRVVVFGDIDSLNRAAGLVIPLSESENILGEYPHGATAGKYGDKRAEYITKIENPLQMESDEYFSLLKNGWVNYVVVNKNKEKFVDFFESDDNFKVHETNEQFVIFETVPKSGYVKINGHPVESEVERSSDTINIKTDCDLGYVLVKESYSDKWVVSVDGNVVDTVADEYGFTLLASDKIGECKINMKFVEPHFYSLFNIVSLLALVFVTFRIIT